MVPLARCSLDEWNDLRHLCTVCSILEMEANGSGLQVGSLHWVANYCPSHPGGYWETKYTFSIFRSLLVPGLLELAHPALKAGFHPVVFNYMSKTASKRDVTPSVAPRTLTAS